MSALFMLLICYFITAPLQHFKTLVVSFYKISQRYFTLHELILQGGEDCYGNHVILLKKSLWIFFKKYFPQLYFNKFFSSELIYELVLHYVMHLLQLFH